MVPFDYSAMDEYKGAGVEAFLRGYYGSLPTLAIIALLAASLLAGGTTLGKSLLVIAALLTALLVINTLSYT